MKDGLMRLGWQPGVVGSPPPRDTEIFKLMAIKGDGVVDPQELKIGLTRLRKGWVVSAELKRVLTAYDANDGVLQPSEFSAFVRGLDFEERAARNVVDPLEKELLQLADDASHLPAASDQNHGTGNALRHDKTSSLSVLEQPDGAQPKRSSVPIPKRTTNAASAPAPGRSSNGAPGARATSGPRKASEPKLSRLQSAAAGASLNTLASRSSLARRSNSRLSDEPPDEEVKGGEIAYGVQRVQREAWNAAVQQFALQEPSRSGSNGSSGYGSSGNRGRSSPSRGDGDLELGSHASRHRLRIAHGRAVPTAPRTQAGPVAPRNNSIRRSEEMVAVDHGADWGSSGSQQWCLDSSCLCTRPRKPSATANGRRRCRQRCGALAGPLGARRCDFGLGAASDARAPAHPPARGLDLGAAVPGLLADGRAGAGGTRRGARAGALRRPRRRVRRGGIPAPGNSVVALLFVVKEILSLLASNVCSFHLFPNN